MSAVPPRIGMASGRRAIMAMATLVVALATLLFVLRPLSLTFPASGLDASWVAVLGQAATRPARWGVDLAFTYGPASALVTRYYTDHYLFAALPVLCGVALVNGAAVAWLARNAAAARRSGLLLLVPAVAGMVVGLAADILLDMDGFVFVFVPTLVVVDLLRQEGERGARAIVAAGAILMGVLALSKTSYAALALILFVLADARGLLERFPLSGPSSSAAPRWPMATPLFLAAALASFLAYGQRIGDLPAYLELQGQVAAGYGEAMYLAPNRAEMIGYALGAVGLVAVVARVTPVRIGPLGRAVAVLSMGVVLLVACKAGFVRADTHTQIAWTALGLSMLLVAIALVLPRSAGGAAALGGAALVVLWGVAPLMMLAAEGEQADPGRLPGLYRSMTAALQSQTDTWASVLTSPARYAISAGEAKAAGWAAIRTLSPLPALEGGIDMLPSEQSAILAAGLDYRPRPSFQDYSTYTAGLIAANRKFYAGAKAPAWVLFGGGALDDRYPTSDEGALWPTLLRDYEPTRRIGNWLALHRRAAPLPEVLGPSVRAEAPLGSPVAVPMQGSVFVRLTVGKTLLGRLAAAVFRPPGLSLRATLETGEERTYRFVPAIAAEGFLLTPIVADPDTFAMLGSAAADVPGLDRVRSFVVGGSPWTSLFYGSTLSVEFRPVTVAASPPSAAAKALFAGVASHLSWRRLVHELGRDRDLYGDQLTAPPPSAITVPVRGLRHLRLEFGLEDEVWLKKLTQGVCFALKASPDAATPLWRRCLDPVAMPADRGRQTAEVALPADLSGVTAETTCLKACPWSWSFWSEILPRD